MTTTTQSSRRFEETHPWLSFNFNMSLLTYPSWLLLGEAGSKCEHLSGAPLNPETAGTLHQVYLSKGIHGTASIEGNTLSETEVLRRIEGELDLPKSREYLGREIDNILAICNDIMYDVVDGREEKLSVERILEFNRRILDGLPLKPDVVPGQTRTHSVTVGISSYRGAPAEDCDYLLSKLVDWLNGMSAPSDRPELRFPIAVLKSVLAHLYIAWIHPFGDGNGRTARMIEFQLMVEAGVPSPAAHLLSNHYNLTRDVYLIELDKTSTQQGFPVEGFINYALQGFVDQLREQITVIRGHQYNVTWNNFVHEAFRDEDTPAPRRQRHLVLDMPEYIWVPRAKLREVSARVAGEYSGKSSKTVTRDLNELLKRGLIVRGTKGYMANRSIISAFLPLRRELPEE